MEEFLARKYLVNQRKSLTDLVNDVGRCIQTVRNATIKTMVKKLPFYGCTTERNLKLFFCLLLYIPNVVVECSLMIFIVCGWSSCLAIIRIDSLSFGCTGV